MLMNANKFAEWMTFISESDEEKLRSGKNIAAEGRVHSREFDDPSSFVLGISVMLASDIDNLKPLVQVIDETPVIDLFDLARSDIPTVTVDNADKSTLLSSEYLRRVGMGDIVSVEVSMQSNRDKRCRLRGRNVDLVNIKTDGNFNFDLESLNGVYVTKATKEEVELKELGIEEVSRGGVTRKIRPRLVYHTNYDCEFAHKDYLKDGEFIAPNSGVILNKYNEYLEPCLVCRYEGMEVCSKCDGYGIMPIQDCGRCGGSGYIERYSHVQGGVCFKCNGKGSLREVKCNRCDGDGVVQE